ncbi:MAG: hypothetical protein H0V56_13005 [Chthoniobacterales bacterium]|nr:hypothetical protein [Chthoniobacterales bacterium]
MPAVLRTALQARANSYRRVAVNTLLSDRRLYGILDLGERPEGAPE